ncbi:MAG: hypothetical protein WEB13_01055 [Dehalococcoidia bacterium]
MCANEGGRPSFRAIFSNWNDYDASFAAKLRLALRNSWLRVRLRQNCCGNDGQPGC